MLTSEEIEANKLNKKLASKGAQIRRRRQKEKMVREVEKQIEPVGIKTLEHLSQADSVDPLELKKSLRIHRSVFERTVCFLETLDYVNWRDRWICVSDKGRAFLAARDHVTRKKN